MYTFESKAERYSAPAQMTSERTFKRGDIFYFMDSIVSEGSEQRSGRPGIIVSNDAFNGTSNVVEAVFLTSKPKSEMGTHVIINSTARRSVALCEQIRTIDKRKIGSYFGHATDEEMRGIDNALLSSVGLERVKDALAKADDGLQRKYELVESQLKKYKEMYDELYKELIG